VSRIAAVIFATLAGLALAGCGSDSNDHPADGTAGEPKRTVVVTTAGGDAYEFHVYEVVCPKDTTDEFGVDADVVYVHMTLDGDLPRSRRDPVLRLTAGADLPDDTTITLPAGEVYGRAKTFVSAFVTRAGRTTEVSEAAEESKGTIEVASASCDPSPAIDLTINGVLHSEYNNGGRATVVGHVRSG
jgi:hypothetical protein